MSTSHLGSLDSATTIRISYLTGICLKLFTNRGSLKGLPTSWYYLHYSTHQQDAGPEESYEKCEVTAVTVSLKNGELMKLMGERKALIRAQNMKGWTNKDDDDYVEESVRTALIAGTSVELPVKGCFKKVNAQLKKVTPLSVQTAANYRLNCLHLDHSVSQVDLLNKKIRDQIAKDMEAGGAIPARVFVTFDTEADQRTCLDIMSCGSLFAFFDASMPAWLMKWLVKFDLKSPEQQELHDFKMFNTTLELQYF